jgi:hypothetical protein
MNHSCSISLITEGLPSPSQAPSISLSPSQTPSISQSPSLSPTFSCETTSVRDDCVIPSPGLNATFDPTLGAPKCPTQAAVCDSGELLIGRGYNVGPEPNEPNTIDSCFDGIYSDGGYLNDESVQQITVSSVGGGVLQEGGRARIDVQIFRYDGVNNGYVWYTADATSSPSWTFIGAIPYGCLGGCNSFNFEFTLGSGSLHAVRVVLGYDMSPATCAYGFADNDDLIFTVAPGTTDANSGDAIIDNVPDMPFEQPVIDCKSLTPGRCDIASNCVWKVEASVEGCYNKN